MRVISRRTTLAGMFGVGLTACAPSQPLEGDSAQPGAMGIDQFEPGLSNLIALDAPFETLATGYQWSEGPTWDRVRNTLYFTDVPQNKAYQWREGQSVSVFLDPSGSAAAEGFREPGANGLWYASDGSLLMCNHGRRAVERRDLESGQVTVLADTFAGRSLNSPNDLVQARTGVIFFTDPPYGLEGLDASPLKQQDANGVYRLDPEGGVTRLVSDMTFPNGIALSPDERVLYVSQSDPERPILRAFDLNAAGETVSDRILFDAKPYMNSDAPGLPDGMALTAQGAIFVTGPGGVFVLTPEGIVLGRLRTGRATANCAFGEDGRTLFITAGDRLLRIRTKVRGIQWS